jgi:hypothetical protein
MLKKACLCTIAAVMLSAISLSTNMAAPKASPEVPVSIHFADNPGDAVKSDGYGTGDYKGNEPQLEAVINKNTGDLLFDLRSTKSPEERYLWFDLSGNSLGLASTACSDVRPPLYSIPSGLSKVFLNVNNVFYGDSGAEMQVGEVTYRGAEFVWNLSTQQLRLASKYSTRYCSGMVKVQRLEDQNGHRTWQISSAPPITAVPGDSGIAVLVQDFDPGGRIDNHPVGYFRLPFTIIVTLL